MTERQGPPSYYWCFAIERFGGWLKRNIKNRKDVLRSLMNIIMRQEQINTLLATLSAPTRRQFKLWQDDITSDARANQAEDEQEGSFTDAIAFTSEERTWVALKKHLQSRRITSVNPDPCIGMDVIREIPVRAYTRYVSGPTGGNQVYRTAQNKRDCERRDSSWVMYYVAEDSAAHRSISNTEHRWRGSGQCWGRVQAFLKITWEGQTLQLAVIETNKVHHFIPEIRRGALDYCPMVLDKGSAGALQIIDVRVVTAVAARITLSGRPAQTEIIYETSLDLLRPDMSFNS
ncbi:hypothetical protein QFC21_005299 [Naganishia friedmannii]|uniref:Uncharacterized protein n=1 Tax=Naganishia friedmannii TaxID=89922 RepID=A0ACC2VBZ6_9TREE|nr:hypothetical protein QFC21_005299 [Naganishia friedmannii]